MHSIETIRHSTAHLLAAAVQELWPQTKFGVGPVVDNGFYYDFDSPHRISEGDFPKIEKQMLRIINRSEKYVRSEVPLDEAITFFTQRNQPYKVELLNDLKTKGTTAVRPEEYQELNIASPDTVSLYTTGSFIDLCRGPHVESTKDLGVFKLTKVAGSYWRGNEKNPMMQRVYGIVFHTKQELEAHVIMTEEAIKRDHRKLGKELDLFTFSDLVGPGLPLWTPRGTLLRNILDDFVWELRRQRGFTRVTIPHITKKDLYERSGHWSKFADELFRIGTREGHEFAMKPMNCPHHIQIFARKPHSYREMPQRYTETTMVYRDEQTGELSGLSRVRCITQDDAHIFCRQSQVGQEFLQVWDIIDAFYSAVGFKELKVRLSLHDPGQFQKYLGTPELWQSAEQQLRLLAGSRVKEFTEAIGEAAFYGPKIDFIAKDSIGRDWQVATIQLDINLPERFDLSCVSEGGSKERIVMIHCAIMGSIERFLSIIIEHFAGAFPVWMAPVQVALVPVSETHIGLAQQLASELREKNIRVEVDESNESVGYKIRRTAQMKVPYSIVLGDQEKDLSTVAVRIHGKKDVKTMSTPAFIKRVQKEMKERRDLRS